MSFFKSLKNPYTYSAFLGAADNEKIRKNLSFMEGYGKDGVDDLTPKDFIAAFFLSLGAVGGAGGYGITILLADNGIIPMAEATVISYYLLMGGAIALALPAAHSIFETVTNIFEDYDSDISACSICDLAKKLLSIVTSLILPILFAITQAVSVVIYLVKGLIFLPPCIESSSPEQFILAGKAYKDVFSHLTAAVLLPLCNLVDFISCLGATIKNCFCCKPEPYSNTRGSDMYRPI